jgi:hypothetical protein
VKLSTHVFTHAKQGGSTAAEITHRVVDTFGASARDVGVGLLRARLVFADCVAEAEQACADLPPGDRDLVLGDAANAMWWP